MHCLRIILVRTLLRYRGCISCTGSGRSRTGVDERRRIRGIIHSVAPRIVVIDPGCSRVGITSTVAREGQICGTVARLLKEGIVVIIMILSSSSGAEVDQYAN